MSYDRRNTFRINILQKNQTGCISIFSWARNVFRGIIWILQFHTFQKAKFGLTEVTLHISKPRWESDFCNITELKLMVSIGQKPASDAHLVLVCCINRTVFLIAPSSMFMFLKIGNIQVSKIRIWHLGEQKQKEDPLKRIIIGMLECE